MDKYRNIVVCGDVGSGTSTLSRGLAKKLGWKRFSGGDFFRRWSVDKNVPLWNKTAIPDEIDIQFDKQVLRKIKDESKFVFDTHYIGWFARGMEDVFRILLICDKQTANERILRRTGNQKESETEIEERRKGLREKFKKLYSNDDYENPKLYNVVINTSEKSIEVTIQETYEAFSRD